MLRHFTETSQLDQPYPRRPLPVAPDFLISLAVATGLVVAFVSIPLNLLLTVKLIRRMGTLSKPSIVAIPLFYIAEVFPPNIVPATIANLFNIAFGSRHQMGQIFVWWILQICVLYFPVALLLAVWHFSLRWYAYAAWLSTFDEDWSGKDGYALWWKLVDFDLWFISTIKKIVPFDKFPGIF
jgi:hypothetical protein